LLNAFLLFKYYLKNKSFPKREAVALSLFWSLILLQFS
jgi:hypothetical protein